MVLRINPISFLLVDNVALVEYVVFLFESDNFLVLWRAVVSLTIHLLSNLGIANHVLTEVDHRPNLFRLLLFAVLWFIVSILWTIFI